MISNKKHDKGFSLIEIIIAIFLIGIIAVFLLPMFSFSYTHLHRSGNRTEAVYSSRQVIDNDDADNDEALVSTASDTLEISFGDITIPIEGENINVRIPYDKHGKTISVDVFHSE